ncbi:MAG: cytochrome c biogenesis protein CcdA [Candidatus Glassbacteria bacterium]|nr:cytochrome c biogenesis protein CcdA [Candidatus Glassbacteria bacterium]
MELAATSALAGRAAEAILLLLSRVAESLPAPAIQAAAGAAGTQPLPENLIPALVVSFGAGIFSFISPCVLPLIPAYISFISGLTVDELEQQDTGKRKRLTRVFISTLIFVLGFSTVFVMMGASATFVSRLIFANRIWIGRVAGALIMVLGLHMTGIIRLGFLQYEKRIHVRENALGLLGVYLIGAAFAFGWTPCIGPILAAILGLAAQQDTVSSGVVLLGSYSLGLGLPFLATGLAINGFMGVYRRLRRHMRAIEIFCGVFLIAVGVLIFFDMFTILSGYLAELFPFLLEVG